MMEATTHKKYERQKLLLGKKETTRKNKSLVEISVSVGVRTCKCDGKMPYRCWGEVEVVASKKNCQRFI